ncbi:MAG: type II toxin-antitoxin system VapC family toxin [Armatimonadota bacterium]
MKIGIDTCVLLRIRDVRSPLHAVAKQALQQIVDSDMRSFVAPQVLAEYWAVATRPATQRGGLGLSLDAVRNDIRYFMSLHELMREPQNLFETWLEILSEYNVSGKAVWDARLAAVLKTNRIQYLVTFDSADFERFTFLHPVLPQDLHLLE